MDVNFSLHHLFNISYINEKFANVVRLWLLNVMREVLLCMKIFENRMTFAAMARFWLPNVMREVLLCMKSFENRMTFAADVKSHDFRKTVHEVMPAHPVFRA